MVTERLVESESRKSPRLLANRDFVLLLCGQTVSNFGDIIFDTTLTLWIAVRIAAAWSWAPLAISGVLAAATFPVLFVGPVAGVFVDRWNKRNTMLAADALRAIIVSALLAMTFIDALPPRVQIGMIYVVVFLVSVCAQFFAPARVAAIVEIVEEERRPEAASISQLLSSLALIIGPAVAAPLFFGVGVRWALALNALSFVVSWFEILAVRSKPVTLDRQPAASASFVGEFADGIRFLVGSPVLRTMLGVAVIVMLGAGAFNALGIFFLTENLHAPPVLFGLVGTTFGAGMLFGSILSSIVAPRIGLARVFASATIGVGILILVLARLNSFLPGLAVIFLLGIVMPALQVTLGPLMLQVTPRELVGRIVSVMGPVTSAAEMVSVLLAGFLGSTVLKDFHKQIAGIAFGPYDTVLTIAGVLALLGGIYAAMRLDDRSTER
jgi:MFS family permease